MLGQYTCLSMRALGESHRGMTIVSLIITPVIRPVRKRKYVRASKTRVERSESICLWRPVADDGRRHRCILARLARAVMVVAGTADHDDDYCEGRRRSLRLGKGM